MNLAGKWGQLIGSIQYDFRYIANREKQLVELESEKHPHDLGDKDKDRGFPK